MKSAFFVSDIHLTQMASPSGEALLYLVRRAQKEASLFVILGDMFDLWLGKGSAFQNEYKPLIDELRILKRTCRIIYFEGNHDLHLVKFWQENLGCEVHTGPLKFTFNGVNIWAEHGDEINRDDKGYLFLRWFLRTPPLKFLIETLPSKALLAIGNRASKASRDYTSSIENKSREIFRTYAQNLRVSEDFDLLITGHTHIADDFSFIGKGGAGRLINLGSWYDGPHFLNLVSKQDLRIDKIT